MSPIIQLGLIAALEVLVYTFRVRTVVGDCPLRAAIWAGVTNAVRFWFVWVGATAVIQETAPLPAVLVFSLTPALCQYGLHTWLRPHPKQTP